LSHTRTITKARPDTAKTAPAPKFSRRIILLSGEWHSYRQNFQFEATIFVTPDGAANGDIYWAGLDRPTKGAEYVHGWARGMRLEFEGYYADPGLALDQYGVTLLGTPQSGPFVGTSVTFGWGGEMSGSYHIVEQKD
jgi:hypothetical protein